MLSWLILFSLLAAFIMGIYSLYSYWNNNYYKLDKKEGEKGEEGFLKIRKSGES